MKYNQMVKQVEDLEIYRLALELSDNAWEIYFKLPKHIQYHSGSQFLDSADSVGANICEGFGRYHYKDSLKFYYNSRGSLYENKFWINRLKKRKLVEEFDYDLYKQILDKLGLKLNRFITTLKSNIKT